MDTATIIEYLDTEISRLQQAKAVLSGSEVKRGPGRPKATGAVSKSVAVAPAKRVMSAESKSKIALAQKTRWAKSKRAANKAAKVAALRPVEKAVKSTAAAKQVKPVSASTPKS